MSPQSLERFPDFDPRFDLSPYTLFRWLLAEQPVALVDVRDTRGAFRFRAAIAWADFQGQPADDRIVVLFDDDGESSRRLTRELQRRGRDQIYSLFGGLTLYDFALDPLVVGEERYLVPCEPK